ncbi:MAG: protein jag [Pyrinomonadaceae bacterium]
MKETCEEAKSFLELLFQKSGLGLRVSIQNAQNQCVLDLDGPDADLLLSDGGELLEAVQHLVNQAFGRALPKNQRLVCDVHGFRATREAELRAMALHAAGQVRSTGMAFTFGSMNANERRIIHLTLSENEDLHTESIGDGSERRLKVTLKSHL